ncbi:MAG: M28 family peptidase [Planctomycetes bacterium]|nr:M28 family peptidase [Planctomycetota bacterium]
MSTAAHPLSRFCRTILPALVKAADGPQTLANVQRIVATDRWNSFDRFHRTTETLTGLFEAAGAKAEVYAIQTGGRVGSGRWIINECADVRAATVDVIEPVKRRILDYAENPWSVIQWTAATPPEGLIAEVVVADTPEQLDRARRRRTLAGKIILTTMPAREMLGRFADTGAIGIIVDAPARCGQDATPWTKFGWGGIPLEHAGRHLVGLVLPARQGAELRALVVGQRPVRVHVKVDVHHCVGTHDLVMATIAGQTPDQEVWGLAHTAEPGASDNAAGVATCVEIARILESLIAAGRLPRPKRTIRLLNGFECFSFFHYLEHARRPAPPLAGVCMDSLGVKPELCAGRINWHATIPMSAGFVDEAGAAIVKAAMGQGGRPLYRVQRREFRSTMDTLIGDPKYGFPCPWINTHELPGKRQYRHYHTSADTPEHLSAEGLARVAAAMAGYLYYFADAGNTDLLALAGDETRRIGRRLDRLTGDDDAARARHLRDAHRVSMKRLAEWVWGGDRREMLARLDEFGSRIGRKAAALAPKAPRSSDRRVPRRTAPLSPWRENTAPAIAGRIGATGLRDWALFWADGRRDLGAIAEALRCEYGRDVTIAQVRAFFEAHAELGYVELIDPAAMITRRQLVADLKALGLQRGMDVMVHSSLSSVGHAVGGADTVIDAILEVLGPAGTLMAPTFNHGEARVFNIATTPGRSGAIGEALRRRARAVRSEDPTHPCVAIGAGADRLCTGHVEAGNWGAESPIGRLIHGGGHILSLGVSQIYSTAYHVAEVSMGCPSIDQHGGRRKAVAADGTIVEVPAMVYRARGCLVTNDKLGAVLDRRGLRRKGLVGHAASTLVKALDLFTVQRRRLAPHCPTCTIRPDYDRYG